MSQLKLWASPDDDGPPREKRVLDLGMWPDWATLEEAQDHLESRLLTGAKCPCCNQFARVYKRKLNVSMARFLIWLVRSEAKTLSVMASVNRTQQGTYKTSDRQNLWTDIRKCEVRGGDYAKLVHWGLARAKVNDDTKKRTSGFWQTTKLGRRFAYREVSLPSHVFLYDSQVIGYFDTRITIDQALGERFDYRELMQA